MPFFTSLKARLAGIFLPTFLIFLAHRLRIEIVPAADGWDPFMHFCGGASIAWIVWRGGRLLEERRALPALPAWLVLAGMLGATALVGVLWEFYEYAVYVLVDPSYGITLADTLFDLAVDLSGATLMAAVAAGSKAGRAS